MKTPRVLKRPDDASWITVAEAARLAGVTVSAIRRRLYARPNPPQAVQWKNRTFVPRAWVLEIYGAAVTRV
jgi:hypothetical protein